MRKIDYKLNEVKYVLAILENSKCMKPGYKCDVAVFYLSTFLCQRQGTVEHAATIAALANDWSDWTYWMANEIDAAGLKSAAIMEELQ